ncbi:hypothetical protein SODALDRAFT_338200 [Sodiomyces alkalinus F11]|uniref:Pyruvate dehydrogenase protein x component n=1 Tax=Sodiomyces alkalinus (strain CBS 110278 / VKM F-3762 / F11) TaxID=1314773 RepID=A0A3N2Q0U9_SODAK|nr:hypothetical protein SODALDRAFT_338200 [Sodiomyces alkalinus F11]ROT40381.1 hypothetical protein SODALDRAFT_338200 [Sodiomyces alkalinus F11]
MASLATACRLSARLIARRGPADASIRGFTTSTRCLVTQNFTMPALSPTMTEGNIATWKVKEGESFAAGDVLLEIETDKATMDVEAQEDGMVAKIIAGDNSKAVQVGTRIAVIAEPGDDLSSLEIPAEEPAGQQQPQSSSKEETKSESSPEGKPASLPSDGKKHEQKYPLLPSVQHLVHLHNIDPETVSRIPPTGPQGRLLKGDVLAYLGTINAATPATITERFTKLSHLDLSNIKVAAAKVKAETKAEAAPTPAAAAEQPPTPEPDSEVVVPLSLAKVAETQRRIQDTLGVYLPLATFVARAAEFANDDLPPSARPPTADELFNQVLGLDKLQPRGTSRGFYLPQVDALPQSAIRAAAAAAPRSKSADLIDILAGTAKKTKPASAVTGLSQNDTNVVSVTVPKGDEKRARVFLERVKVILEQEPARLVL